MPLQQVTCALHPSLTPEVMLVTVEEVVAGFTAFVSRWRNRTVTTQCAASVKRALLPSPPRKMARKPPRASAKVQTMRPVGRDRGRVQHLVQEIMLKARLARGLLWTKRLKSATA